MNLIAITQEQIFRAVAQGLRSLERPEPLRLSEWAEENFYLSTESSYDEGPWEAYPYQSGIMDTISNDDVREVVVQKSARVGYTKIILAAIGYFAEHKRRNQAIFQPVDDDRDEFVKTELDPMLRDVPAVRAAFPSFNKRSKHNTLRQKTFTGSSLHCRGGKAAKNYRRISVDVVYFDELDGFDRDIEREGDPYTLGAKRVEGSTFPKIVAGSTPKFRGESLIEYRREISDCEFLFRVPCPHCGHRQPLRWGGKDEPFGIKWTPGEPATAAHLCETCGALFAQGEYLGVWTKGRWETDAGAYIDSDGLFRDAHDQIMEPPQRVAFHIWAGYSPRVSWPQLVREFLDATKERSKLKTFINTTLGETWEEDESEQSDDEALYARREHYRAPVPAGALLLTAGIDTQDDRFEIQVDGWGVGEERWTVDYIRLYGDPGREEIWNRLAETLRKQYRREDGALLNLRLACQDHGGHFADGVNRFSKRMGVRFLIPVKGSSVYGRPVAIFPRKRNAKGVYLTEVGTDTAKEWLYHCLGILEPGRAYWHWPVADWADREYFKQLCAEKRIRKYKAGVPYYVWDAGARRQEPWDCSVYSLVAIRILQQHMGINLEVAMQQKNQKSISEIGKKVNG